MRRLKRLAPLVLLVATTAAAAAETTLTVVSWGGVYEAAQRQALFDPFTEATGIRIDSVVYSGGIDSLRDANADWDLVDMIEDQAIAACDEGLLSKISIEQVAEPYQGVPVEDDFLPGTFRKCSVAQNVYSTVFAYNDKAFLGEKPATIADFFDPERFPGKRAVLRDPDVILEWALMAEGVPIDQVYDLLSTERGIRLAFRKLDELRGSIIWWENVGTPVEMLKDGRAVMASGYNGRFFSAAQDDGLPITIVWDGQVVSFETWAIPASSEQQSEAQLFIRFATAPEQLAALAELIPYGPTRISALSHVGLHEKSGVPMRDHLPNSPQHRDRALFGDSLWYARTKDLRERRFQAWLNE
ncbi:MAG: ABC transporter substrate-binding protein [Pseudomonadota bacterium]